MGPPSFEQSLKQLLLWVMIGGVSTKAIGKLGGSDTLCDRFGFKDNWINHLGFKQRFQENFSYLAGRKTRRRGNTGSMVHSRLVEI